MMKTNPPLSRETLLRTIDQCAPLDAVVDDRSIQRIMHAFSRDPNESTELNHSATARPIPLMDVAAYVDGTLTQPDQLEQITAAAVVDPGLLMEIVLARRAEQQEQPSKEAFLGDDLRNRLLALHQAASMTDRGVASTPPLDVKQRTDDQEQRLPVIEPSVTPVSIESVHPSTQDPRREGGSESNQRHRSVPGWVIGVAAALLLAAGAWMLVDRDDQNAAMVEVEGSAKAVVPDSEVPVRPPEDDLPQEADSDEDLPGRTSPAMLAEKSKGGDTAIPDLIKSPDVIKSPGRQSADMPSDLKFASDPESAPAESPDSTNAVMAPAMDEAASPSVAATNASPPSTTDVPDPSDSLPMQPNQSQLVATWSQIDGLLVRSDFSRGDMTSASGSPPMESIQAGSSFKLAGDSLQAPLRLRTLPLCRAVADLDGGGQLVVASDTLVEASAGGTLYLHHGSIALLDVNDRSTIRLGQSIRNSVSVSSGQRGSLVVRRTMSGLEIDATENPVIVNGESFANMTVRVDGQTMTAQPVGQAPERLPKWTRQRVDRIELGRNVLAQLASSSDIRTSLATALGNQDARSRGAETLRTWLVEASSDSLLRLISSGDPVLRERALNHMRSVTPDNPKHVLIWRAMAARSRNPRTMITMRAFFVNLWSNERPLQARREQLLRMLQATDPASRVAADYLLRAFYGPGPAFDIGASAQVRARTVNAWRTVINRVDG